ncbi:zinc-binding alcohol dehydrogenase family protein [Agrilactobacillus yilanensis]|uniref:Zinc-type alcohol dehydrogenase-like protein n=1 Tax=Agrilactobacillus yilanensis TaxID=2485997 RepID=A0ABW4J6R0_9LACO|nr:zinc-binding alcohol dehydrogenase family protein [Agrilactobacillus yilanensis]
MKAVQVSKQGVLQDVEINMPILEAHDVLVEVAAVSVNPVDYKRRQGGNHVGEVLGYDAVGTVAALGEKVSNLAVGQRVYYAGDASWQGTFAEYHAVDQRLVALAPQSLDDAQVAAMPLTGLTAMEILHDKLGNKLVAGVAEGKSLLIINGAGGVGSVLTQLAHWLGYTVIATASPKNHSWLREHGVDFPVDYHDDIEAEIHALGIKYVDTIVNLFNAGSYVDESIALVRPFGHIVNINRAGTTFPTDQLQAKSVSLDWELMFTKSQYGYDMSSQGALLRTLAAFLDQGTVKSTTTAQFNGGITAANVDKAHALLSSNQTVGKIVVTQGVANG